VDELLDRPDFFVAVLDLEAADPASTVLPLLRHIKRRNPRIAAVAIDGAADFRRRHLAYEPGADLYLRKPKSTAAEEMSLFTDDLMLFIDRRFAETRPQSHVDTREVAVAARENPMNRGFRLLVELIKEVSDPTQVTLTILQLAADYLDRGVLFAVEGDRFLTLGKFGIRGNGGSAFRLRRGDLSVLDQVAATGKPFHAKVDETLAAQLAATFAGSGVGELIALPMLHDREVVGVLYGDNAIHHHPIEDTLGLEVFLSQAGLAFRNAEASPEVLGQFPNDTFQFA
jgi:CheY-like chemotaxis protein